MTAGLNQAGSSTRTSWATAVAVAAIFCVVAAALVATLAATFTSGTPQADFFASSSPWNRRIPAHPKIDPRSDAIISYLAAGSHPAVANIGDYGVALWPADRSTPRYDVDCTLPWGECELEQQPVPVPEGAHPPAGTDAAMIVVDEAAGAAYEFWRARKAGGTWTAAWGGVVPLAGDGRPGAAVGAGVSRLAGVARIEEVARGRVGHALVFSTDNACQDEYRHPATRTDGHSSRRDCIPEGARIQLDPDIDLAALRELTPIELIISRALQDYGAYAVDNGGSHLGFIFETPTGGYNPYPNVGLKWDYFALDGIPWSALRVLHRWDGK